MLPELCLFCFNTTAHRTWLDLFTPKKNQPNISKPFNFLLNYNIQTQLSTQFSKSTGPPTQWMDKTESDRDDSWNFKFGKGALLQ
jgi:hypothetical protein